MADTALKFGPEWLRALTEPQGESGGVLYSAPLANIKLAEFRYGKEEILALFDKAVKPLTGPKILWHEFKVFK